MGSNRIFLHVKPLDSQWGIFIENSESPYETFESEEAAIAAAILKVLEALSAHYIEKSLKPQLEKDQSIIIFSNRVEDIERACKDIVDQPHKANEIYDEFFSDILDSDIELMYKK